MKIIDLTLPSFAWLSGGKHDGNNLNERNVILHTSSLSVIEIFRYEDVIKEGENDLSYKFGYINREGVKKRFLSILHASPLILDHNKKEIIEIVMKPAAEWYRSYCDWEDGNIINEGN